MNKNIIKYTNIWYNYVSLDHHKDRDCHFYVEGSYSYGKPPVYNAYHHGYIMGDWAGPIRNTIAEAEKDLEDKLRNEINSAILDLEERVNSKDEASLIYKEEYMQQLKVLKGE